ncbi:UDP-N-acetylglucosamine-N-acetylmuramylpentapeptide N-acetylglucosamine transferase [Sediminihabitans luteus]|uniref:UDP-N-acetylglucosamine--N-acetylmuramyl-(pentapeptide) pyrophosphoryl-undecaprenol N-acetylglucosamine transferase n=1 Tax=Sediminihabitans luteus TaxID=1138585 RepID=A0A2M9CCP8_9CELL|nr:undecaprenyldiphospho-muramoylpentapeptide beta-N-acetylglucosaminyltransferase [Sediminihabitans luteus]PJJ69083.1 UDP-N-acetylglucosamine-N-acetylmuramylpentapeptide N-acetylglucosamine transferase [Sediminihabitans luteus]GII99469.1 UDP-N-acetylglucosamine--N-acetylmuramyl-(pentapeptide) pyrophosphoryl-undecaprenol N-acetylglucosamine transferase [Sediminihabitans luteus]
MTHTTEFEERRRVVGSTSGSDAQARSAEGTPTPAAARVGSVVLAGGGTAGHVNPLLAVADELRARDAGVVVTVLGTAQGLEADLVPRRGYPLVTLPRVPMPRRPSLDWFRLPGRFAAAVRAAGAAIDESGARAVVGFGGYVSTPAYVAARRRRVPIVVHEGNARPGLANRVGARWASSVALTFPGTGLRDGVVTGLPLRHEVASLVAARASDAAGERVRAAEALGLDPALPTLLVTGGSLGALSLNTAVSGAAGALVDAGVQVLHLTGRGKDAAVREAVDAALAQRPAAASRYAVREYLAEMHLAYAVADLVVCRSGAGSVCELAALGIPGVYVPLPIGNGEQRLNATPLVEAGGGILVDDAELTTAWVEREIVALLADASRLGEMSRAATAAGIRDGAARVADLVARAVVR